MGNILKERWHKVKVWATGEKFRTITCFFFMGYAIEDLIPKSQEDYQPRKYFEILMVCLILFGLKAIREIVGLMGQMRLLKVKHQHILDLLDMIQTIGGVLVLFGLWNDVPSPESTMFPQDFCTKGELFETLHT